MADFVRVHGAVAMETLAKLFYLEDLAYEIQERSTAVDHKQLTNMLWLAIGDKARDTKRASILARANLRGPLETIGSNLESPYNG